MASEMPQAVAIVCAYTGPPNECVECGGYDQTGTGFCSHDCHADFADRGRQSEAALAKRRADDDAFAEEANRLRLLGHGDEEIDELLKDMP
jgi:hypothetical protein